MTPFFAKSYTKPVSIIDFNALHVCSSLAMHIPHLLSSQALHVGAFFFVVSSTGALTIEPHPLM